MLLHARNKIEFDQYAENPPHALLLVAPEGAGKRYVLTQLAKAMSHDKFVDSYTLIEPLPDKKTIGIDQIRELKASLKLRANYRRVVIIPDAFLLTEEAQNSMLKMLEEPPEDVHFLLSVRTPQDLLQTILSRIQLWQLLPVSEINITEYFNEYDASAVHKAVFIADGRLGLVAAILAGKSSHPLMRAIDRAKELLAMKTTQRLSQVDSITKDKQKAELPLLIDALELICKAAMEDSIQKQKFDKSDQWKQRTYRVLQAREAIAENVQPKLVLTDLFLNL